MFCYNIQKKGALKVLLSFLIYTITATLIPCHQSRYDKGSNQTHE